MNAFEPVVHVILVLRQIRSSWLAKQLQDIPQVGRWLMYRLSNSSPHFSLLQSNTIPQK